MRWAPDGRALLIRAMGDSPAVDQPAHGLWLVPLDGAPLRLLAEEATDWDSTDFDQQSLPQPTEALNIADELPPARNGSSGPGDIQPTVISRAPAEK